MNKEKEFWNTKGKAMYASGEFDDPSNSNYEFDILSRLKINSGQVLEIGPGSGRDIAKFKELGFKLNAIDIASHFINNLNEKFEGKFVVEDLRNINKVFSDIDLIYSRWSILFLKYSEFKDFLVNVSSVLSKNGRLMASLREGDKLENIHVATKTQSLQMNVENLIKAMPDTLEVEFIEIKDYATSSEKSDKQILFVLKKKTEDKRKGLYL